MSRKDKAPAFVIPFLFLQKAAEAHRDLIDRFLETPLDVERFGARHGRGPIADELVEHWRPDAWRPDAKEHERWEEQERWRAVLCRIRDQWQEARKKSSTKMLWACIDIPCSFRDAPIEVAEIYEKAGVRTDEFLNYVPEIPSLFVLGSKYDVITTTALLIDAIKKQMDDYYERERAKRGIPEKAKKGEEKKERKKKDIVRFDDVKGLDDVKRVIRRRIVFPFIYPEIAAKFRKKVGGGVLLYGPPGTGKTMLAKAVAGEIDAKFFSVRSSTIVSKWLGESEQNMRDLFKQAREAEKAVIFFDEIEAIIGRRDDDTTHAAIKRVVAEFLAQMDGIDTSTDRLLVIGATNRPWSIDEAALRPGRFDEAIYVPLPDKAARLAILQRELQGIPAADDVALDVLADKLEGFSGADIAGLVQRMTDFPYEREITTKTAQVLTQEDVRRAIAGRAPSVSDKILRQYEAFAAMHNRKEPSCS